MSNILLSENRFSFYFFPTFFVAVCYTMSSTEVFVLFEGYSRTDEAGKIMKANCACTLIKSNDVNILVDTMTPWDKDRLIAKLKQEHKLDTSDIHFLVCTHGHADHIGNNNLFLNATHVVGQCVHQRDEFDLEAFTEGHLIINSHVKVVATPGHTLDSVSVEVQTDKGLYLITGDLFEKEEDIKDESIWREAGSEDPEKQVIHRQKVLSTADFIVPGHGPMFRNAYKK